MNISLTARGIALVNKMKSSTQLHNRYEPDMHRFTLVKLDGRGRIIRRKKIMIDVKKYFRKTA